MDQIQHPLLGIGSSLNKVSKQLGQIQQSTYHQLINLATTFRKQNCGLSSLLNENSTLPRSLCEHEKVIEKQHKRTLTFRHPFQFCQILQNI